jgi:non-ribosomal peptide synthetase component E (peptide arylation enzyme)
MSSSRSAPLLTLLTAPTVAAYTAAGLWGAETIYNLAARHARTTPRAPAVRDHHCRLNYTDLVAAADRLAACLAGLDIRPGQRVAVWLPSRVETAIALLACSRNGYVCCPSLHRDHTVGEITALVDRMRASALIAQQATAAMPTATTSLLNWPTAISSVAPGASARPMPHRSVSWPAPRWK